MGIAAEAVARSRKDKRHTTTPGPTLGHPALRIGLRFSAGATLISLGFNHDAR